MTQVEVLEQQITELDDDSFAQLREWFIEFDQARWDKKLEADSNAGKLDFLIDVALAEHKVSAIATEDYLQARAERADLEAFKAILAKTPDREPLPGDEL